MANIKIKKNYLLTLTVTLLLSTFSLLKAETEWQLTMGYTKSTGMLELVNAQQLEPSAKKRSSPGVNGAMSLLPVEITWLDEGNKVLATSGTVIPLGLRVSPQEGSTEHGLIPEQNLFVLRVKCSAEKQIPSQIKIEKIVAKNALAGRMKITQVETLPLTATTLSLNPKTLKSANKASVPQSAAAAPGPTGATKIQDTGADDNRLVIVFVGDGYLEEDITSGKYAADVQKTINAFKLIAPWPEMMKTTNIYSIDTVSNERGADLQDKTFNTEGTYVDTYYNTSFWTSNIARLLYADSQGRSRAFAAADAYVGAGNWDQIVMIVNSNTYGGAGGTIAVNSMDPSGPAVSVHEVGHSLAGLADEYFYFQGNTFSGSTNEPNVDTNGASPKWNHWIEAGTPLPTTGNSNTSLVGSWEGAKYADFGVYRPRNLCGMRATGTQFCPICREAHLKKMFTHVSLVDSASPLTSGNVEVTNSTSLSVDAVPLDGISYQWYVDGVLLADETSATLTISTAQLAKATQPIKVETNYASSMMRQGQPSESTTWTVENKGVTAKGIPHWWLAARDIDINSDTDDEDSDNDGKTNAQEYEAGTDPTDKESVLAVQAVTAGAVTNLKWKTVSGRNYRLEQSTNLTLWTPVTGKNLIVGDDSEHSHTMPTTSEQTFYRLVVWTP